MSIGQRIKSARKEAGLTQQELAKKTSLSRSYIGDLEIDRYNPSVSTLNLIANAVNTTVAKLLGNDTTIADNGYYHDPEVAAIAQEMHDNPDIKVLFHATKGMKKESIEEIRKFVEFQKAKENGFME